MDGDGETAPEPRYLPHELVSRILLRLPFKSLMRFTCVCKTWHSIITSDQSFQREHHRLQEPCVLIAPLIKSNDGGPFTVTNKKVTTPGLYRWEKSQSAATLVQAMDSFPAEEARHKFTHCNGLVLMPMAGTVRVLNPATRRLLVLPGRPHIVVPKRLSRLFREGGALGIGHDPRSNTYKVARFFYRYVDVPVTSGRNFTFGVEVFTIGRDTHWRETAVPPPHPIIAGQTASFLKGSLLWTIDESLLEGDVTVRGFLRFSLEDESFSVIGAPPGCPKLQYLASSLAEMGGELYLVHKVPASHTHLIWVCDDVDGDDPPRWVQRHAIKVPCCIHPVGAFDDGIVFQPRSHSRLLCVDSGRTEGFRHVADMHDLRYHHPDTNTSVEYREEIVHAYDIIPYVPSLVPV
jgi:F-box interacting protein